MGGGSGGPQGEGEQRGVGASQGRSSVVASEVFALAPVFQARQTCAVVAAVVWAVEPLVLSPSIPGSTMNTPP